MTDNKHLIDALVEFISHARWFGGKGRPFEVTDVRRVGAVGEGPTVLFDLVELTYADTGDVELYQLPLAVYADPQERLDHALLAEVDVADHGHSFVYDAVHDRDAMAHLLRAFAAGVTEDGPVAEGGRPRRGAGVPPAARVRARPGRPLDAVQRRAVQLLGDVRRGLPAQGLPQGHARGSTRTSPSTRCSPGPAPTTSPPSTAGWRSPAARAPSRSSSPCSSSSSAPRATGGTSRSPASATCSPRRTCTPTRWAATSPPRRPGWARPWPTCTGCWPSTSPPRSAPAPR